MAKSYPKHAEGITTQGAQSFCYVRQIFRGFRKSHQQAQRPITVKAWLHCFDNGTKVGRAILTGSPEAALRFGQQFLETGKV